MYASPAAFSAPIAAEVFAICMSERIPSCILAPPDAENITSGSLAATAASQARAMRSPVPVPRLPPMNAKSITPRTTLCPSISQVPTTTDSVSPVLAIVASTFDL